MVSDRRFVLATGWRFGALLLASLALIWALMQPGYGAVRIVAAVLWAGTALSIWRHVTGTNDELLRFIEALNQGDLSQRFAGVGGGFSPLGGEMDAAMIELREERKRLSAEGSLHAALVDEVPIPILAAERDGRVRMANKAARRMFHEIGGTRVEDYAGVGADFVAALSAPGPARQRLAMLMIDGVPQRALLSQACLHRADGDVRVVSVQPIQSALNTVEVAAQADLVRVLTHEIMNSMTPVTSLAESAAELMREVDIGAQSSITDARIAVETLARRAKGIMGFVESYRQYSRPLQVNAVILDGAEWADSIVRLFEATPAGEASGLELSVVPPELRLDLDPDLMCQVVLNLLKNGAEAAQAGGVIPRLQLSLSAIPGGRAQISVADNGPGVAPTLGDDVFLPFFTTKSSGTGVGLSLARKIVTAHGGSIRLEVGPAGGARFVIVL